jgi:hypothetical protein
MSSSSDENESGDDRESGVDEVKKRFLSRTFVARRN